MGSALLGGVRQDVKPLPSPGLKWRPCEGHEKDAHLDCTTVEAPKDYFNSSAGSVYIAVARYKATTKHKKDRKGSIFINPGGPGGSGKDFAYRIGPLLSTLFDGAYDLIGFDPRGIGDTRPRVNCFGSARKLALFKSGTFLDRPFDVTPDLFSQENIDLQTRQWAEVQALRRVEMEKCTAEMGADELRYMSSSSVVRDIDFMSRQLEGEDAPINFIGASYGTVLGAYLANMLPAHRLGRIAIDGVVCPRDWSTMPSEYWLKEWLVDAERAYEWFLEACERAGPDECALMQSSTDTAANINDRLERLVEDLYRAPVPVAHASRPGLLTSGVIRTMQYDLTYTPQRWSLYADLFADVLAQNYTRLFDFFYEPFPLDDSDKDEEELSRAAVTCGDVTPYADPKNGNWPLPNPQLLANLSMQTFNTTRRFAVSSAAREPDGGCEFHPALGKAPERFVGPWNNTLVNSPLLVISNTADPTTPRKCGLQVLELMGTDSARLVTQNSPGHCSYRSVATCTWRAYRDFFLHGIVPPPEGKYCDIDNDYFDLGSVQKKPSTTGVAQSAIGDDDGLAAVAAELSQAWSDWDDHRRGRSRGRTR
ncbi:hypothetical protein OC846_004207 [Tilletia horrida]|uniref:AB hydrolase-1 domain-containing protein n=1 Tax=Tilletia horrida TaxID=155126 RepID=A0AAN6GP37_9BASI|nr:hypothetical protein OC846_004207 [Tilletia horrida]